MRTHGPITSLIACAIVLAAGLPARAGDDAAAGREILKNHKEAVVTVELVVKLSSSFGGGNTSESENKVEVTGTVISPEGLTVLALSSTDPSAMYKAMYGSRGDAKFDAQVEDIMILGLDNTEIPAEIVIRDRQLDLAFARPLTRPEEPMPYVDIEDSGSVEILDRLVTLNRLPQVANRVHSASFEYVDAVVEKPRRYYIPGNDPTSTGQGSPAFRLDGKIVGIFVVRAISSEATTGSRNRNILPIILPAADILEGVEQIPPFDES